MFTREDVAKLKPLIERVSFSNTHSDKLERGDILYFGYSGARQDSIINPCIIFSGLNTKTGCIEGVNMRMFYIEKKAPLGINILEKYGNIYWDRVEDSEDDTDVTYEKKKISYYSHAAFTFENLNVYKTAIINEVINGERKQINLMQKYWRSYQPLKMHIINDEFAKVTNSNISVNLQVANVIINTPPKQLTVQRK